jgi:glycosylphosphatidylinositol transamidase
MQAGRTILKQMAHGIMGSPSGPEGLFGTYRIDAIALFAHPADGPHGFHTMGNIVESSLRSLNNLLERLHQSFFLYLLQSEARFLSVAMYLIVPLLIGVGLTIRGLAKWSLASKDWDSASFPGDKAQDPKVKSSGKRPAHLFEQEKGAEILWSLRVIALTHLVGAMVYWGLIRSIEPRKAHEVSRFLQHAETWSDDH